VSGEAMEEVVLYNPTVQEHSKPFYVSQHNTPISQCKMFNAKEFAFIGISLGNSYFSEKRLEQIFESFGATFKRVAVLLVDKLAVHNYRALGYTEQKIHQKMRKNINVAINRVTRAMERAQSVNSNNNIKFYRWSDVEEFSPYHDALEKVTHLYETQLEFQNSLNETTQSVIEKYLHEKFEHRFLEEAKWYFLKEVAFGSCINEFFDEESVLNCYYHDFKFYREFFEKDYMQLDSLKRQNFITYRCGE
jgi:tRNA-dependent cyclodipeptide synthase